MRVFPELLTGDTLVVGVAYVPRAAFTESSPFVTDSIHATAAWTAVTLRTKLVFKFKFIT